MAEDTTTAKPTRKRGRRVSAKTKAKAMVSKALDTMFELGKAEGKKEAKDEISLVLTGKVSLRPKRYKKRK